MSIQNRNDELVDLLRTDFQHRNEPNFAWKSAVSAVMAMPGIVAVWPMSVVRLDSATDRVRDVAGGGYHLIDTNGVLFGYAPTSLIPIAEFLGTNEYLLRADGGAANWADVTGAEAHIRVTDQGLTFGGWFYIQDITASAVLMAKWSGAADLSYILWMDGATSIIEMHVTSDGTAATNVHVHGPVATLNGWHHVVGVFDNDGNTIDICVNGAFTSEAFANTIFDGDADFTIGASGSPSNYLDGYATLCFLAQCGATDAQVTNLFQQTRALFGV